MNRNDNGLVVLYTVIFMAAFLVVAALINEASTPKCIAVGCDSDQAKDSSYCYLHKLYSGSSSYKSKSTYSSSSSSSKNSSSSKSSGTGNSSSKKSSSSSKSYSSYDEGYEDVYENDDYDWDRYYSDDDYADGVDDAMDELDW